MKTVLKNTLIAGSSFTGGLLAGFLLSSKKGDATLQVIQEKISDASQWLSNYGRHAAYRSEANLRKLSSTLKNPLPDLYSATESFCLNEEDLMDG